jgi:phosphoribosyl-ATP pyrophosphohydrolase/phosphoribosyl-AMP cyclohydrolase
MVISSIDLMNGKSVQLKQGKEKILERDNPFELAADFNRYGEIAVIDLDAAMGKGNNDEVIKKIIKKNDCRVGGGIKTIERAKELILYGAKKIIIGSIAFENDQINHPFLNELASKVDKTKIIIAIDALNGGIVTNAWLHKTELNIFDVISELDKYCSEYLFTCVEREGTLQGIDMDLVKKLKLATPNKVTVAGGIYSTSEIRRIAKLDYDVQLGMALYTGKISLTEAFIESLNWKEDLLPVITQNYSGEVLMQAYCDRDSIKKTFETGKMWYYSRSREKLWMKGESSGNEQKFLKFRADCDRDSLLATIIQKGPACHLNVHTCFGDRKFSWYELLDVINDRLQNPKPGSYTITLTDDLLAKKIMEEAQELIEAKEKDHIIWEAADVLYFLTVLLAKNGIEVDDILFELSRRRKI